MNGQTMGNEIKLKRVQCKLTRDKLAYKLGIASNYLYQIERGTKISTLEVSTTVITIGFGKAPETGAYSVTIIG
jgi:DNA-binding XRE family transcriptional regulator